MATLSGDFWKLNTRIRQQNPGPTHPTLVCLALAWRGRQSHLAPVGVGWPEQGFTSATLFKYIYEYIYKYIYNFLK